jgi:hypothetical protein
MPGLDDVAEAGCMLPAAAAVGRPGNQGNVGGDGGASSGLGSAKPGRTAAAMLLELPAAMYKGGALRRMVMVPLRRNSSFRCFTGCPPKGIPKVVSLDRFGPRGA